MKPLLDGSFVAGAQPPLPPLLFAAALVGIFLVRGVLHVHAPLLLAWVSNRVVLDLRAAMFARLVRFPTRFYDDHSSGALLSKVAYDVTGVTAAATTVLTVLVRDSPRRGRAARAGCFYLNWKLTLIALVIGAADRAGRAAALAAACAAWRAARSTRWATSRTCWRRRSSATRW